MFTENNFKNHQNKQTNIQKQAETNQGVGVGMSTSFRSDGQVQLGINKVQEMGSFVCAKKWWWWRCGGGGFG